MTGSTHGFDARALSQAEYTPFPSFPAFSIVPFDPSAFDSYSALLRQVRESTPAEIVREAVLYASRSAAVDTGAIEGLYEVDRGFTATIAEGAANWEYILAAKGESTKRAIEDAIAAYDLVLDGATGSHGPVTESWIRQLHETLCAHQDTFTVYTEVGPQQQALGRGEYKTQSNSPINLSSGRVHDYARPLDTPPEMQRLLSELNSDEFATAHPILQAAYAHYAFVCIHPFADGNGRVARALASSYLYREPGVPLVIFADQKNSYIDALEAADAGEYRPFVAFIGDQVIEAVTMVRLQIEEVVKRSDLPDVLAQLESTLRPNGGLSHLEVDAIASHLLELVSLEFVTQAGNLALPQGVRVPIGRGTGQVIPAPPHYRPNLTTTQYVEVVAVNDFPADVSVTRRYGVFVAQPGASEAKYLVAGSAGSQLDLQLEWVHPTISTTSHLRIGAFVRSELTQLLQDCLNLMSDRLRERGYLS